MISIILIMINRIISRTMTTITRIMKAAISGYSRKASISGFTLVRFFSLFSLVTAPNVLDWSFDRSTGSVLLVIAGSGEPTAAIVFHRPHQAAIMIVALGS